MKGNLDFICCVSIMAICKEIPVLKEWSPLLKYNLLYEMSPGEESVHHDRKQSGHMRKVSSIEYHLITSSRVDVTANLYLRGKTLDLIMEWHGRGAVSLLPHSDQRAIQPITSLQYLQIPHMDGAYLFALDYHRKKTQSIVWWPKIMHLQFCLAENAWCDCLHD